MGVGRGNVGPMAGIPDLRPIWALISPEKSAFISADIGQEEEEREAGYCLPQPNQRSNELWRSMRARLRHRRS